MPKEVNQTPGSYANSHTMEEVMQAHQFLYYVEGRPVWSDAAYDKFCKAHCLEGDGGSDMDSSYSHRVKALAARMKANPDNFRHLIPSS